MHSSPLTLPRLGGNQLGTKGAPSLHNIGGSDFPEKPPKGHNDVTRQCVTYHKIEIQPNNSRDYVRLQTSGVKIIRKYEP